MAAFKEHVKLYIIQRLACFDTPSEVAEAVAEEFNVNTDRSQIGTYDPTTHKGRELGPKLKEFFFATREEFLRDINQIPMANRSVRVRELSKLYYKARNAKNIVLAASLSEQIAKEMGNVFTNKQLLGADAENPLLLFYKQISGKSIPVVPDEDIEDEVFEGEVISFDAKPEPEREKGDKKSVVTKRLVFERD